MMIKSKALKRTFRVLLVVLLVAVLVVGGYVAYLTMQYERIEDGDPLEIQNQNPGATALARGETYTALTYNIGFGAYNPDFSFFMDSGVMLDGAAVTGSGSRAASEAVVRENTAGALATAAAEAPDFLLLQEADVDSDRSFHINQTEEARAAFPAHASVFASNFHSAFLAYPITQPHGAVNSGLLSLVNHPVEDAVRRSFPVDESFPTKFFDLDRCFSLMRLPVEGETAELVLINLHMSAYDAGGLIRAAQLEMLSGVLAEEQARGNWVVLGGDFNHALAGTENAFASGQQQPAWVYPMDESALPPGFSVVAADNLTEVATCRSTDMPYTPGVNYTTVLDGFIVSDNVDAEAHNIDAGFEHSDHNPVRLQFSMK